MLKRAIGVAAVLFIASSSLAIAQDTTSAIGDKGRLSQSEFKILTDLRLGIVKAALQLTPEQQRYWPAVEEAVAARGEARYRRLTGLTQPAPSEGETDPVQLIRQRADMLSQRAAGLNQLADAWQPLYQTLAPDQRTRMRTLALRAGDALRAAESRRGYDEDDDEG
jgi:hypothetical protein